MFKDFNEIKNSTFDNMTWRSIGNALMYIAGFCNLQLHGCSWNNAVVVDWVNTQLNNIINDNPEYLRYSVDWQDAWRVIATHFPRDIAKKLWEKYNPKFHQSDRLYALILMK